jgi:WD40 repeat protein
MYNDMSKTKKSANILRNWPVLFIPVVLALGVLVVCEKPHIEPSCASSHKVLSLKFSPDGAVMASGGEKGEIRLWDIKKGSCIRSLREHKGDVKALDYSPNGRYLASAGEDRVVRLWDTTTYKCIRMLSGHTSTVNSLCFSRDGAYCASGSSDIMIRVWEISTGKCVRILKDVKGYGINTVSFSADGRYIASAEKEGAFKNGGVTIWNWRTGEVAETLGKSSQLTDDSVLFSPDGTYIAAWTRWGNYMVILDSQSGSLIRKWGFSEHAGFSSVCLSENSSLVAISGEDKGICIWKARSGETVSICKESPSPSECLSFSPGDSYLASGDSSGIRIWDVSSGKLIISIMAFGEDDWACWTPDAHYNCSGTAEQQLFIHFGHFRKPISGFGALLKDPDIMKKRIKTARR